MLSTTAVVGLLLCLATKSSAQGPDDAQKMNWQHMDLKADGIFGISTDKAYAELLKGKKAKEVLVAVIDGGVDTAHQDLQPVLWHQKQKWGWSFLGSAKGNLNNERLELTRMVAAGKERFGDLNDLPEDTSGLALYKMQRLVYLKKLQRARGMFANINEFRKVLDTILHNLGKTDPSLTEFMAYIPETSVQTSIKAMALNGIKKEDHAISKLRNQLEADAHHFKDELDYTLNLSYNPRDIVGDDIQDLTQRNYGTADVMGPDAKHGSHVSGIIAAVRNNGIGLNGVADHVKILNIRAVPNGDERDKDVANAIIYAVDQGAKVINMSFGKPYSPNKSRVDEALKYAMAKDVLLVHAAGNESVDLDGEGNYFPNKWYADGSGSAQAWLNVGASGPNNDESLVARFSNFGKTMVDVFAPGVGIYSAVPNSAYQFMDGTSMAAPVVSGLAALIRSYYPRLNAVQVKEIIMASVVKVNHTVKVVKKGAQVMVPFAEVCVSGGVVNAYEALKLAATYK
ncbi:S8 family serine peptidase [Pedobacter sp. MC2016-14]|uniref:S8 family serine peptidase n=1 Tax=Pedobacter sp. MC2016-14 TaxID=2897327 RepID=UPI001E3A1364|nr:S8 family serine peptidase [Pedobacter sp. MC2016-14]MCD0487596.1 S8 family serine peptidase [Pedobacter sp. MC2016-14]